MQVICDIETDKLINPEHIWCIVCKDIDTGRVYEFKEDLLGSCFRDFSRSVSHWIGHNFISFDHLIISNIGNVDIPKSRIIDTLILSRLLNYGMQGGHSLEAWGERLGYPKILDVDFSEYNDRILERCKQDVELNYQLYLFLKKRVLDNKNFDKAVKCEHGIAILADRMHDTGFKFNYDDAKEIERDLTNRIDELDNEIKEQFLPSIKPIREILPKLTKTGGISKINLKWYEGNDFSIFENQCPFTLVSYEAFNAGSPTQVVERLNQAGWKPVEKTKGHIDAERSGDKEKLRKFRKTGWKISERNLATLPPDAPEAAHRLVERLILSGRLRTLNEWFHAYSPPSSSIHGTFMHIGTWTHRMSHRNPNMGNVPTAKSIKYNEPRHEELAVEYGKRLRQLWTCDSNEWLVGTDADSIHLRILVHLIDDEELRNALVNGSKDDGTDFHSLGKQRLGPLCKSRDQFKTFIYSFLNGARAPKVAEILNCSRNEGQATLDFFYESIPGLKFFRDVTMKKDIDRGYFQGLDGRFVVFPSPHQLMSGYLQNGEAIIMKYACLRWHRYIREANLPAHMVNFVHDEWQTVVSSEDEEIAKYVGELQCRALKVIGEELNVRCPIAGNYQIGKNWYDTH